MFRLSSPTAVLDHIQTYNDLSFALVEGVVLPKLGLTSVRDATFIGCVFAEAQEMPDDFSNTLFVDCTMAGLKIRDAVLFGAQFIRCDLTRSQFRNCDLSATQFRECRLDHSPFLDCDVDAAVVPGGVIENAPRAPEEPLRHY